MLPRRRPEYKKAGWKVALFFVILLALFQAVRINNPKNTNAEASGPNPTTLDHAFKGLDSYLYLKADATRPYVDAKSYLLMDADNGNVLYDYQGDKPSPVASTTKMVTALVASQHFQPTEILTVSPTAAAINGSKVGLKANQKMTVANLLNGLLISSGNEIARTLAEAFSGQEDNIQPFIDEMNKFVVQHHLKNTHFVDPAGLNDDGTSTAYDLAQIGRILLTKPDLAAVVGTGSTQITSNNGQTFDLTTTNKLLLAGTQYHTPDVIGVKTGFTPAAGYCLVAAEHFKGRTLIGVVLGVPGNSETSSAAKIQTLFRWAAQNIDVATY